MSQNHSFGDLLKWSLAFIMTQQNNYSRLKQNKTKQNKTNNKEMKKGELAQNIPCHSVISLPRVPRMKNWLFLNLVWHSASTTSQLPSKGGILNETDWLICAKFNQHWAKIWQFQKLINSKLKIQQPGSILSENSAKCQMLTWLWFSQFRMKFNPYCSGSSRLEIYKKRSSWKVVLEFPCPEETTFCKGTKWPKNAAKWPKKEEMGQIWWKLYKIRLLSTYHCLIGCKHA